MVAALRSEHAELEKKWNAQLADTTLMIVLKIEAVENTIMQRFEEQPPQTLDPGPTPIGRGRVDFKVISSVIFVLQSIKLIQFKLSVKSHANKLLYPRTLPLSALGLDVPSISEVLDFMKLPHVGPTIARFRIDPASRPNSPWNLEACRIFAEDFCAKQPWVAEGKTLTDVSREFYLLIPEFTTQHALASGFADLKSHNRFHESLRRRVRKHKVGYFNNYFVTNSTFHS